MNKEIRLVRVFNPIQQHVKSFVLKDDIISIGSGTSADMRIPLPSLNWEHLQIDFAKRIVIPLGDDIVVDNSPLGVLPCSFANASVVRIHSIVLGLYTSFEDSIKHIKYIHDEGMNCLYPCNTRGSINTCNTHSNINPPFSQAAPLITPLFNIEHCDCVVSEIKENSAEDDEMDNKYNSKSEGDAGTGEFNLHDESNSLKELSRDLSSNHYKPPNQENIKKYIGGDIKEDSTGEGMGIFGMGTDSNISVSNNMGDCVISQDISKHDGNSGMHPLDNTLNNAQKENIVIKDSI